MANALEKAEGLWGYDPDSPNEDFSDELGCHADPLEISIDPSNLTYKGFRQQDQYHTGKILDHGPNHITLQYDDEERMMGDNEVQKWTLLLVDDDMFVWVLGSPGDFRSGPTEPRYRCKSGVS
jgi:hypothetical protein